MGEKSRAGRRGLGAYASSTSSHAEELGVLGREGAELEETLERRQNGTFFLVATRLPVAFLAGFGTVKRSLGAPSTRRKRG